MQVIVETHGKIEPGSPVLICGLPGSGYVAKLGTDHMVKELDAKLFADIYSDTFPPHVMIKPNGSAEVVRNQLYHCSLDGGAEILILTGDAQPATPDGNYLVAEKVLEIASGLGCKDVYALAAYITGGFVANARVFGTATDREGLARLETAGVITMGEGSITGMNGLIVGLARVMGMRAYCLLGETSGYMIDPKAASAVLQVLAKMLGITLNVAALDERAKETEAIMKSLEEMKGRSAETPRGPSQPRDLGYIS